MKMRWPGTYLGRNEAVTTVREAVTTCTRYTEVRMASTLRAAKNPVLLAVNQIAQSPGFRECLGWFSREKAWINDQHLQLCRIPAPTFLEQKRAEWMVERFRSIGYQ